MLAHKEKAILEEYGDYDVAGTTIVNGDHRMAETNPTKAYQQSDTYTQIPAPGIPTYTEAWALIEAARRMASASDIADLNDVSQRNKVRDAIRLNWRLWTIFQAEMTIDENADDLSDEIRNNMLTLCKFVDEHTVDTLKSPDPEKIKTLIEINRNIAAGLLESLKQLQTDMEVDEGESESDNSEAPVTSISTSV